jgi:hypothetical protein
MISYYVSIPDSKRSFLKDFLDSIGANYEQKQEDFELTNEQIKTLGLALKEDKKLFVSRDEISRKHNL